MRFRCPWSPTIPTLVCISTWGTCEKVYLFCIICSSSRLSHTFGFHLCSVPLVLLSSKRICIPELGIGELGWPTKAIFEMCGTGQLSPLLKQQTTSACQRPDLCVCVSRRLHFSIRQEPPTPPMLSQTWISYFCLTMRCFPLSSSLERRMHQTVLLS